MKVFKMNWEVEEPKSMKLDWHLTEIVVDDSHVHFIIREQEWAKIFFNNHQTYLKFTKEFKTTSGSWQGERGHWLTALIHERGIRCANVSNYTAKTFEGVSGIRIWKDEHQSHLIVEIQSRERISCAFECMSIEYSDHYECALLTMPSQRLMLATNLIDERRNFIGTLD